MTYAPADLLAVQRYAREKTGQDWASLGIIHSTPQGGGYHEGHDLLHAVRTAPEDPGSDYSYTESQRDRRGLTDAASAFDFGGNFPRFREFNAWIVGRARAGDPRCRDIREIIYTPDGRTVRRFDALGIRSSGDSSHLTHTHTSFFRDSEGRRARADNFLGLLQEFFDGAAPTPTPEVPDMAVEICHDVKGDASSSRITQGPQGIAGQQRDTVWGWTWAEAQAAKAAAEACRASVAELREAVAELAARPAPGTVTVTDEQLERVLRRVMGSVDGASPTV